MKDKDFIINLIENGYECDYLDFKAKQYSKEKYESLLKDIMAMANSKYEGDKYIIVGIKDKPSGERDIIGINSEDFIDSSNYQQVVLNNIEPEVSFDYFPFEYKEKLLGVFKIYGNQDRPYMLKKKYNKLNEGLCLVRKGSQQSIAVRKDFDEFYLAKEKFEVKIMDPFLQQFMIKKGVVD
ncbi:AlbA family DNA-binding domain-containing protein [Tepidibacter mesophilus]|uniref:AlbA family DNA-binding domain-containing protein n=1 Tax=Tepidibacter mesophilus TaxID=655607 RepID=UPI000C06DD3D|nr:ATP-binding protein [Tepidibacter mesophilus]